MEPGRPQRRILLAGFPFDGPYPSPEDLQDRPGVWVALEKEEGSAWRPIEVGRKGVMPPSYHPPIPDRSGEVGFAGWYSDSEHECMQIEQHVQARYGVRRR